jgi:hypothetical protein
MANDCLFCRIVKGEIPAKVVAQNDHCVAFNDINPQAPTHVVIVPREHIGSLNEAKDAATIGHLSLMAAEIARSITLFLATFLKIPVSTTHTITSAIVGVGSVTKVRGIRWGVATRIVYAWIFTIPAAAAVGAATLLAVRELRLW